MREVGQALKYNPTLLLGKVYTRLSEKVGYFDIAGNPKSRRMKHNAGHQTNDK